MVYLLTNCIKEALHALSDTVRANSSVGSTAHLPMPEVEYCKMGPKCTAVVVHCMRYPGITTYHDASSAQLGTSCVRYRFVSVNMN